MTKFASFLVQATLGVAVGVVIVFGVMYVLIRALEIVADGGR